MQRPLTRTLATITFGFLVALAILVPVLRGHAGPVPNVTTAGYSNLRDNWDQNEPYLSPADVSSSSFGERFSTQLDGSIYAQPLVYEGLVIVTTEKATTYAINAITGAIKWQHQWGVSFDGQSTWGSPFEASTIGCGDLVPDLGSTSTPVIDPATGILYVTTRLEVPADSTNLSDAHWYLQAINTLTGTAVSGWPTQGVEIQGTPYNTPGVAFNDNFQMQRPGLLLLGGVVYLGFASDCDITPYRGIITGVSTSTKTITSMWSDESGAGTDANSEAGIWQGGGGLVALGSNSIIVASGNGASPTPATSTNPPSTLSESVIRLGVSSSEQIAATQFFAPYNAPTLDAYDEDLGSGGPIALPSRYFGTSAYPNLIAEVGKSGILYLLNANNLGGYQQGAGGGDAVVQESAQSFGVWGHPAAYGGQGGYLYVVGSSGGPLEAYAYSNSNTGPGFSSPSYSNNYFGYASGSALVTSNGTNANSAVVWAESGDSTYGTNGTLIAYNAIPSDGVMNEIWSAPIGTISKFATPTAWNGHVYVGTRDGDLISFGLSANRPISAASVNFNAVRVGHTRTVVVHATVTQALRITGAVTTTGQETVIGAGTHVLATTTTTSPVVTTGLTAGPKTAPPTQVTTLDGRAFRVRQPAVGSSFSAGSSLTLRISYSPTSPGQVVGSVIIPTSRGNESISISGFGSSPGLVSTLHKVAFGAVELGAGSKVITAAVTNSSTRDETITGVTLGGGPFSVVHGPRRGYVLHPRQMAVYSLAFHPSVTGSYASEFTVRTAQGSAVLPLTGEAQTGRAVLSSSTTGLNFGNVQIGTSVTLHFTVTNTGTIALMFTQVATPAGAFVVQHAIDPGQSVDPGTVLDQSVTFTPTSTGPFTGVYRLNSTSGQPTYSIVFSGTGVAG